ncbi:uncharacterized protein LOC133927294 isoform X2 [Phragmites australis]|uniref:uncharacterized protein LOC133927294 isoform X2 n=1 Tax=Phragmites australis TaxID=29695 RepID=UPI002D78EFCF|nr:uncharacterized protein LOC133927294 isoform X2 [Phragmites australis]
MRIRASGMATDLLGTHRIRSALLEIKDTAITIGIKSRDCIHKIAKLLLKARQKLLYTLEVPMDKHSRQDSKESVRRTIMEHDKLFRQQKSLMTELGCENHSFQSRTEETHEVVQGSRPNLKSSPSTSETNQSARLDYVQHSAPQQVPEHLSLQECKPGTCLSLFSEETSTTKDGFHTERPAGSHKSVEDESWSASVECDLDLKLSIGPSSHATKGRPWLFSGSRERHPSGQHP